MINYDKGWDIWADNRMYGATPRHIRRMIAALLDVISFESILDIGCGSGDFLRFIKAISKNRALKIAGIDLSDRSIKLSKSAVPEGEFKQLDIEKGCLGEEFDLIVASDVLEHLDNDIEALKNIRRMAKRYFICNTVQGRMYESEKLVGHVRNYTKEELVNKLDMAGFRPLKVVEWGFPFYNLCKILTRGAAQKAIYGKYGIFKKTASWMTYLLFTLNSSSKGDILIVLSEVKKENE